MADIDTPLAKLTRSEKLSLVRGTSDPDGTATGYLSGVPRLDIPPLRMVDGPLGIRAEGERATAFPATLAAAATFDADLRPFYEGLGFAIELGEEAGRLWGRWPTE